MILAVDIGNTNICVAVFSDDGNIESVRNYPDNLFHTAEEFASELKKLCDASCEAVMCSVVPALTNEVYKALKTVCGEENVSVIDSSFKDSLVIKDYDRQRLGNDRVVDMVAARELYGVPAVVFDMGTCTTVSVLDGEGAFIGGMIMPGLGLSINSLSSGTALLPGIKPYIPTELLGNNTVSCINNGVIFSQASAVEGICQRVEKQLGRSVNVVVTGGAAKFILPVTDKKVIYDEHLLLKGMLIALKNKKARG